MRADMDVIASISQKGGSGKTTLSTNLAAVASSRGRHALILDLDPQASATHWADGRDAEDTAAIAQLAGTRAIVVLNGTPPYEPRIEDAAQAIAASGLEVSPERLGNHVAYQDAAAGAGVLEHQPNGKAAAEVLALYDFVTEELPVP